jgi:hypothetical protein
VELDAEEARAFIEANAPGVEQGWCWQGSWSGLYSIIVAGQVVHNPWKHRPTAAPQV